MGLLSLSLGLLSGCSGTEPSSPVVGLSLGPEITCEEPVEGFQRLQEEGPERGLGTVYEASEEERPCPVVPGGVLAGDLDGDGDLDLLFHQLDAFPVLYASDGDEGFAVATPDVSWSDDRGRRLHALGLADRDGDGLPEVWAVSESLVVVSQNLGGLVFGPFEAVYDAPELPRTCHQSLAFTDLDADGDLDLLLPGADLVTEEDWVLPEEGPWLAGVDRILLMEAGELERIVEVPRGDQEALSLIGIPTDWDDDGDIDVVFGSDRAFLENTVPLGWFRNDGLSEGLPVLSNDSEALGADTLTNIMGAGIADLNGDGALDYCFTDLAPSLTCLVSDGAGAFYGAAKELGLVPDANGHPDLPPETTSWEIEDIETFWTTWGLVLQDLDNDGWLDLGTVAGGVPERGNVVHSHIPAFQPDGLYRGTAGGFVDESHTTGFHEPSSNYGLVAADFDRDGALDLVVGPHEGPPAFWSNPCTPDSWLQVDLVGPAGNTAGLGARVTLTRNGLSVPREVGGPSLSSQGPPTLHFGLGQDDLVDALTIRWPDGTVQAFEDLPVRRVVTVTHPEVD